MSSKETKTRIIDAAMAIVRDQGAARLTLDETARRANVSKGGVLYHFTSKDALIRGMVERLLEDFNARSRETYDRMPEGPYRWARTMVETAFAPDGPGSDPAGAAVLAAVSLNPTLLHPIRAMFQEMIADLQSDGPDPDRALLIGLILDGLFLNRVTGLHLYDDQQLSRLKDSALAILSAPKAA